MKQRTSRAVFVLGTNNLKKGLELQDLLDAVGIEIRTLADFPEKIEVVEDGASFAENARKKASQQAAFLREWVIAEDSGICVDFLDGAPGIYSARFSDPDATDEKNNRLLLEKLEGVPTEKRTAYYTCSAAVADPSGEIRAVSEAYCRGLILFAAKGTGGFGYDPLFEIVEYHKTFGELDPSVKQAISHRSRAMRLLIPELLKLRTIGE